MARGRNGAPKKAETSSSVSEGWVWEVPSQRKKSQMPVIQSHKPPLLCIGKPMILRIEC